MLWREQVYQTAKEITDRWNGTGDSIGAAKEIAEAIPMPAEIDKLRANMDLLCAAIADDSLSRVALQTVARNLQRPMKPTPEVIAWAQKIIRERHALEQKAGES